MEDEKWLAIAGYQGYEVSNNGRVRSVDRFVERHYGDRTDTAFYRGRVLRPAPSPSGHMHVWVRNVAESKSPYRCEHVHLLVLKAFRGEPGPGLQCCHNDGNPANNCLDNLRWDTRSANGHDRVKHGNHFCVNKTHCLRGHELVAPNLLGNRKGMRVCRSCHAGRSRSSRHPELDFETEANAAYARYGFQA